RKGIFDERHRGHRTSGLVKLLDGADPVVERHEVKIGGRDLVQALEQTALHSRRARNVKSTSPEIMAFCQMEDCPHSVVDRNRRSLVLLVVLDSKTRDQTTLENPVDPLHLVITPALSIRPDETEAKNVARNATRVCVHEDLFA